MAVPLPHLLLLLLPLLWVPCFGRPLPGAAAPDDNAAVEAVRFMRQFGYLESSTPEDQALYSNTTIREALVQVQMFGGIEQTGVLDEATRKLIKSPRCGVPDVMPHAQSGRRERRYVIGSEGWKKKNVTYRLVNWSPKLGQEATEREVEKAFQVWEGYSRLRFSPAPPYPATADIEVFFARGPHGDGYPLDGPGGILAHAFYPYEAGHWGGDMHFDEDEQWMVKPPMDQGVDIFTVAVHELGHSLGLAHSFVSSSVMFPYYKGHQPNFRLDMDDIYGLYQLYIYSRPSDEEDTHVDRGGEVETEEGAEGEGGKAEEEGGKGGEDGGEAEGEGGRVEGEGGEDVTTTTTTTATPWRGCRQGVAGCTEGDGAPPREEPTHDGGDRTRVRGTKCRAEDICTASIDAAALLREELFFFSGECLWRMKDRAFLQRGYPAPIRQLFNHLPEGVNKIDAAYQRLNDSAIIIFSGKQFWISDGDGLIQNSPRPLTDYGLPSSLGKVNAAMVWGKNDKVFIFSSNQYWRYNESTSTMDDGYPQPLTRWRGVPENLDAVLTWTDGASYFFKGSQFWRFDNILIKTEDGFPLTTSNAWFDCPHEEED
ncbi:matrix metalloproteinase-17-like [Ischnura elegans]|uniref:matrix metalloproteinase-17-like n=1 Tax=Ischnura elegans TaxID=197161 RepID=UPI001ED87A1C|nr:matrix metalloproteinase-17-like [Ischnura elegans]